VFLKLDVQGFESAVLEGAREILPYVQAVQTELSAVALYEGQSAWTDVASTLVAAGLGLACMERAFTDPDGAHILQYDALFVRPIDGAGGMLR